MKKPKNVSRTKMLMLLSLMFLSIAVLCMGVLAAESATYNIAGNISYNMVDYVARINTRVYKVEGQTDETGLATGIQTLSDMTFEQIERSTDPYYVLSQKLDTGAVTRTSDTTTNITGNVNIEYGAVDSSVEYYTFYVVINIKETTGSYVLSASLNETVSSSTTSYMKSNQSQSAIEKSNTQNIVMGFSLRSTTGNSTESFSYTLTVNTYKITSGMFDYWTIYTDGSIDYWYVKMGKTSEGKDVRWRLVSTDGTSKYVYDASTTPSYSDLRGSAIFVQETLVPMYEAEDGDEGVLFTGGSRKGTYLQDTTNNYYESGIRSLIKEGSFFNITGTYVKSLIKNRLIANIDYVKLNGSVYGIDTSKTALANPDSSTDKFWLLDYKEWATFLSDEDDGCGWKESEADGGYWLRSLSSESTNYRMRVQCGLTSSRVYSSKIANLEKADVRAAFQLA